MLAAATTMFCALSAPQVPGVTAEDLLDANWRARNRAAIALADAEDVDVNALLDLMSGRDDEVVRVDHPGDWSGAGFGGGFAEDDEIERLMLRPSEYVSSQRMLGFSMWARVIQRRGDLCVPWATRELAAWVVGERRIATQRALGILDAAQAQNEQDHLRTQASLSLVRIGEPARAIIDAAMQDFDRQDSMAFALGRSGDAGHAVLLELVGTGRAIGNADRMVASWAALEGMDVDWLRAHPAALDRVVSLFLRGQLQVSRRAAPVLKRLGADSVPALRAELENPGSSVCMRAIGMLVLLAPHGEAALEDLALVLDRLPPLVAAWAAQAFAAHAATGSVPQQAVDALCARFPKATLPAERLSILEAIGRLAVSSDDACVSVLIEALDSKHAPTRTVAIRALRDAGIAAVAAFDRLEKIANDPGDPCRLQALSALARMGRRGLPLIERAVLSKVSEVDPDAEVDLDEEVVVVLRGGGKVIDARGLGGFVLQRPVALLSLGPAGGRREGTADLGIDASLIWVVGAMVAQDPEILRPLLLWLEHRDPRLRRIALLGYSQFAPLPSEFLEPILEAARDEDLRVRRLALDALAAFEGPPGDAVAAWLRARDSAEVDERETATAILAALDDDAVRTASIAGLADAEPERRSAALGILATRTPLEPEIESHLIAALDDPVLSVRTTAIELLGRSARPDAKLVARLQQFIPLERGAGRKAEAEAATIALLELSERTP